MSLIIIYFRRHDGTEDSMTASNFQGPLFNLQVECGIGYYICP